MRPGLDPAPPALGISLEASPSPTPECDTCPGHPGRRRHQRLHPLPHGQRQDLAHSQAIISDLIETVLREVEPPLAVAKLEGDAVFFSGRKTTTDPLPREQRRALGQRLVRFLDAFRQRVHELEQATLCRCSACRHIGGLKLKLIAHSGEALFHRIDGHEELAGPDVIIVHRLLKNSVAASEYILLTEPAAGDVELPHPLQLRSAEEHVADIGVLRMGVR
ncbi:MAG: DUF2652 domain-containing protein [Verrucomicrobia bacterium]|nr:DUF2652 domain-containing protein [Verrucomicrobiota bacterium]